MAKAELDFKTDGDYWQSENGTQLKLFAYDLYALTRQDDNIALTKAARVLLFNTEGSGVGNFIKWHQVSLLTLDHFEPPRMSRRQLVVAQLIKATIAIQTQNFTAIHSAVRTNLIGSGLEEYISPNPDPTFANRILRVSLEFPEEPWSYDLAPLTTSRRRVTSK